MRVVRTVADVRAAVAEGQTDAAPVLAAALAELTAAGIVPEYVELRAPDDLRQLDAVDQPALLAVAARVGPARLIDNRILEPAP